MKWILPTLVLLFFVSCSNGDNKQNAHETPKKKEIVNEEGLKMNPKYPNIPQSDLGITVVTPDGWDENTFDFHLNYCQQMMREMENEVNTLVFCDCFLSKIQYYYPPIHFKEAYQDQKTWNTHCYQKAEAAKAEDEL